jgi:gluconate kinase
MIALDNDEMSAVMYAARPLEPRARTEFLQAVAAELEQQQQRGPGAIYRTCRELQKRYFDPPIATSSEYD